MLHRMQYLRYLLRGLATKLKMQKQPRFFTSQIPVAFLMFFNDFDLIIDK